MTKVQPSVDQNIDRASHSLWYGIQRVREAERRPGAERYENTPVDDEFDRLSGELRATPYFSEARAQALTDHVDALVRTIDGTRGSNPAANASLQELRTHAVSMRSAIQRSQKYPAPVAAALNGAHGVSEAVAGHGSMLALYGVDYLKHALTGALFGRRDGAS